MHKITISFLRNGSEENISLDNKKHRLDIFTPLHKFNFKYVYEANISVYRGVDICC